MYIMGFPFETQFSDYGVAWIFDFFHLCAVPRNILVFFFNFGILLFD